MRHLIVALWLLSGTVASGQESPTCESCHAEKTPGIVEQ